MPHSWDKTETISIVNGWKTDEDDNSSKTLTVLIPLANVLLWGLASGEGDVLGLLLNGSHALIYHFWDLFYYGIKQYLIEFIILLIKLMLDKLEFIALMVKLLHFKTKSLGMSYIAIEVKNRIRYFEWLLIINFQWKQPQIGVQAITEDYKAFG